MEIDESITLLSLLPEPLRTKIKMEVIAELNKGTQRDKKKEINPADDKDIQDDLRPSIT